MCLACVRGRELSVWPACVSYSQGDDIGRVGQEDAHPGVCVHTGRTPRDICCPSHLQLVLAVTASAYHGSLPPQLECVFHYMKLVDVNNVIDKNQTHRVCATVFRSQQFQRSRPSPAGQCGVAHDMSY